MLAGYPLAPGWVIILPASRASHFVTVRRWLLSLALLGCLGWEKGSVLQLKILSQRVRCRYMSEQLDSRPGPLGFLLGFLFPFYHRLSCHNVTAFGLCHLSLLECSLPFEEMCQKSLDCRKYSRWLHDTHPSRKHVEEDPVSTEMNAHICCFCSEFTREKAAEYILQKRKLRHKDTGQILKAVSPPAF